MRAEPPRPGVDRIASTGPSTAARVGPEQAQRETRQDGLLPTARAPATASEFVTATRSGSLESAARQESSEGDKADLVDRLETIHYHHVLVDDPGVAAANVAHMEQAINNWTRVIQARTESPERELPHPAVGLAPALGMAELDQRLEQFAYRHVLVDDPHQAHLNLDMARSTVRGWSELTPTTAELAPAARAPDDRIGAQRWAFDHGLSPTPVLEPAELDPAPPELGGLSHRLLTASR